jgi:hypothetical protein
MERVTGESYWKARKFQEAAEIYRGGDMVISSLSFDIHPVWLPLIRNIKFGIQPTIPLVRRLARLQERGRTIQLTQQAHVVIVARPSVYCIFSASPATRRVGRVAKRGKRVTLCKRVQRSRDAASSAAVMRQRR